MAKLKNMEMQRLISGNENINISKSFFGLSERLTYVPTGSTIDIIVRNFTPDEGARLERLLASPTGKIEEFVSSGKRIADVPVGNVRLEAFLSQDGAFAGFQLFRFTDFSYHPIGEARFYEGDAARIFASVLR